MSREHPDANLQQLAADRSDRPVIAVFGQVPRDSNILAWSRIDSAGLVAVVRDAAMAAGFQVVVKRHPSMPDQPLPEGTLAAPAAMSPRALVAAADFVATINPSTALEGLLQARPVYLFGDGPFSGMGATREGSGDAARFPRLRQNLGHFGGTLAVELAGHGRSPGARIARTSARRGAPTRRCVAVPWRSRAGSQKASSECVTPI